MSAAARSGWVAGLNHGAHDAACALLHEGQLVAWVEQERVSRRKHATKESPGLALRRALDFANIDLDQLDCVALGSDHARLAAWLFDSPEEQANVLRYCGHDHLFPQELFPAGSRRPPLVTVSHHLSHVASAYYASGFKDAAGLVMDAMGEDNSTTLVRCNHSLATTTTFGVEESLGYFYEAASQYAGFSKNEAGKFMGLAAYGSAKGVVPLAYDAGRPEQLWGLSEGKTQRGRGGILARTNALIEHFREEHFPFTPGLREEPMAYKDFAACVQRALEDAVIELAKRAVKEAGSSRIVLAGGVSLNCSANGKLAASGIVSEMFVQPAANDAGVALGAALVASADLYGSSFKPTVMRHAYWGLSSTAQEVERELEASGLTYSQLPDGQLFDRVARLIADGGVVAWHQGRAEIGPRALGARSILGDPRTRKSLVRINQIKGREIWRPLAPSILEDAYDAYFEGTPNPFMIIAARVRPEKRSRIPAVVHVDGSARPQSVEKTHNPRYHGVISAFEGHTGIPVLINTSLNLNGEPICCSAKDSIRLFENSAVDALVIDNYMVERV